MKVGDLVRATMVNREPNIGTVMQFSEFDKSKFVKVILTNGYIATYRISNLEVICK